MQRLPDNRTRYRYGTYYKDKRKIAMALAWVLRHRPLSLQVIRGLDVCTDEIGVPNWVLGPLIKRLRRAAYDASGVLRARLNWDVPCLRMTAHAGEDFVHLLTGLRRVDEAIVDVSLQEGDRIGHGLALGTDPQEWCRRAGSIPVMCEERLFDLVWEWSWYTQGRRSPGAGRQCVLDRQIAELSEWIFSRSLTPHDLLRLQSYLRNPWALRTVGFPDGTPPKIKRDTYINPKSLDLLTMYLTDPCCFWKSREIIRVDPCEEKEEEVLVTLQKEMRHKVGMRGIAVEVNPTSNLLIGDLGDLQSHPLWRLRPPRPREDIVPMSVCIGSDDPLIFASNLPQEYQCLSDAMTLAGLSDEEVRLWIRDTCECGLDRRFTLFPKNNDPITAWYNLFAFSKPLPI